MQWGFLLVVLVFHLQLLVEEKLQFFLHVHHAVLEEVVSDVLILFVEDVDVWLASLHKELELLEFEVPEDDVVE